MSRAAQARRHDQRLLEAQLEGLRADQLVRARTQQRPRERVELLDRERLEKLVDLHGSPFWCTGGSEPDAKARHVPPRAKDRRGGGANPPIGQGVPHPVRSVGGGWEACRPTWADTAAPRRRPRSGPCRRRAGTRMSGGSSGMPGSKRTSSPVGSTTSSSRSVRPAKSRSAGSCTCSGGGQVDEPVAGGARGCRGRGRRSQSAAGMRCSRRRGHAAERASRRPLRGGLVRSLSERTGSGRFPCPAAPAPTYRPTTRPTRGGPMAEEQNVELATCRTVSSRRPWSRRSRSTACAVSTSAGDGCAGPAAVRAPGFDPARGRTGAARGGAAAGAVRGAGVPLRHPAAVVPEDPAAGRRWSPGWPSTPTCTPRSTPRASSPRSVLPTCAPWPAWPRTEPSNRSG